MENKNRKKQLEGRWFKYNPTLSKQKITIIPFFAHNLYPNWKKASSPLISSSIAMKQG